MIDVVAHCVQISGLYTMVPKGATFALQVYSSLKIQFLETNTGVSGLEKNFVHTKMITHQNDQPHRPHVPLTFNTPK